VPWVENAHSPFHYLWDLLEEIRTFDFFLRRAPCHIVGEQVREDSLAQGNAEPTEEKETRSRTQRGFLSVAELRRLTRTVSRISLSRMMSASRRSFSTTVETVIKKRHTSSFSPSRYSKSVKPTFPEQKKTTVVASQISKLCI